MGGFYPLLRAGLGAAAPGVLASLDIGLQRGGAGPGVGPGGRPPRPLTAPLETL